MGRVAALWEEWADEETLGDNLSPFGGNTAGATTFPDTDLVVYIYAFMGANPTASTSTWPTPTDLSSRLLDVPIRITRGRSSGQQTLNSGSCTLVLDNSDGYLTPQMPSSPYYDLWDVGTPVVIAVDGVGASPPYRRFSGYVTSIEQTIVTGTGGQKHSAVTVTLGGVLGQRTQGSVAKSPLYRTTLAASPVAYWPLEDEGPTRTAVTPVTGGMPFTSTVDLDFVDGQPGTLRALNLVDTALSFQSAYATLPSTSGFQVEWIGLSDKAADTDHLRILITPTSGILFQIAAAIADGNPHHFAARFTQNGADISIDFYKDGVYSSTTPLLSTTIGTTVQLQLAIGEYSTGTVTISHMAVYAYSNMTAPSLRSGGANGYKGEQAHVRFARICAEEGIPYAVSATESRPVGEQAIANWSDILRELEAVDHGMMYELAPDLGLGYRAASERYNIAPAMTIDLATYRSTQDLAQVLTPVRNNQRIRNEWTITRDGGATRTYKDSANQAKRGRYDDSDTVNVYTDNAALDEAAWRTRFGVEGQKNPRYRTLPIDVAVNSSTPSNLLNAWLALMLGDRVDRTGNPTPEHSYNDARLTFEGYTETLGRRSWTADVVVEFYEPWHVQQLAAATPADSVLDGWLVPDSLTLQAGVDATATSWSVAISPVMDTSASNFPAGAWCEGELITITACAGGSSPQTWTVIRSVNGVSKAHSAAAVIELADPLIPIP